MKNKILAATTAFVLALSATSASAQAYWSQDQTSFDKLRKGIQTYDFSFKTGYTALGGSYSVDGVTFSSADKGLYGASGYSQVNAGGSFLYNNSGDLTVNYGGSVLGLVLESYSGAQTIAFKVNGVLGSLKVGSTPTFIGFDNGGATKGISVTFDENCSSLEVLGFQTAVPEAATWAMMMVGLGVGGGSLRRRRAAATGVRFA